MNAEIATKVIAGVGSLVAMVLIWRLVETAMAAGIDGVMFFGGVAAIAGLGGYELRWLVDILKAKNSTKSKEK